MGVALLSSHLKGVATKNFQAPVRFYPGSAPDLAHCRRKTSSNRSSGKSGKYSMSSSSTGSERRKPQSSMVRERRHHSSECSAEPDHREKKNEYGASTTVKNETTANEAWQDFKIPPKLLESPKTQIPLLETPFPEDP